jgi:F-type H+-transporting ATPase subunit b
MNGPIRRISLKRLSAMAPVLSIALIAASLMPRAFGQQSSASTGSNGSFITAKTAQSENIAAAQEEDETAVYKNSASVRAIGHLLHLSPRASSVVFEDFNFLILAGVIVVYGAKALPKFFRGRQEVIDKQLVEARAATEDANERLRSVEERLSRLDSEIAELRSRAEKESAADEQRIKESIEEERKKVVAAAEHEITAMSIAAERSLRNFGAELAIARASGRLTLTEQDDRAMIHDFGASLERRRN